MTPGLPALSDDRVRSRVHSLPGFLDVADRVQDNAACRVDIGDVRLRVTPEERNDPRALLQAGLEPVVLVPLQHQVHRPWPVRAGPQPAEHLPHLPLTAPAHRERAERTGLGHGGSQLDGGSAADWGLDQRQLDSEQLPGPSPAAGDTRDHSAILPIDAGTDCHAARSRAH
jgi:hypothetical protein